MATPATTPDWKLLVSAAGLGLSLLGSYGAYKVQQADVAEHGKRLDKLEASREEEAKQRAELDKRVTVGAAQTTAILEAVHRIEEKLDHLTPRSKE